MSQIRDLLSGLPLRHSKGWDLLISEEVERLKGIAEKPKEISPIETISSVINKKTKSLDISATISNRLHNFLDIYGIGIVREIILKSSSSDFRIIISVDDKEIINRTFSELAEISTYSSSFDAFEDEDNEKFIFQMTNINFLRRIKIGVLPSSNTKFDVYSIYDVIGSDER